jgi:hypothetical protein
VVNTTFRLAPWADAIFAMDRAWWDVYAREVKESFAGERFTSSAECRKHGLRKLPGFNVKGHSNSGACAIALAAKFGAARVILLGYDMQKTGGRTHWHGSHPKGLGDAGSMPKWAAQFAGLARMLRIPVVNASRQTALTAFPRASLEDCLGVVRPPIENRLQVSLVEECTA